MYIQEVGGGEEKKKDRLPNVAERVLKQNQTPQ